jgi:hypothetical protein
MFPDADHPDGSVGCTSNVETLHPLLSLLLTVTVKLTVEPAAAH